MLNADFKPRTDWNAFADAALDGRPLAVEEGLEVLRAPDEELLPLLYAAYRVRSRYFGNKVILNMIMNAKSGLCPEDCAYCSQSAISRADIPRYSLLDRESLLAGAREALERGASTFCIVASGRGPTDRELREVAAAVREIRAKMPLKICACLGLLREGQAELLAEAGVHRYNHNLNTSRDRYGRIATTHTYEQRVETVERVKAAGISPCSGVIIGMGEKDEEIVGMALALRALDVDSIPVNFLNAIPGTPLEGAGRVSARKALKVLALFRFVCPDKEIRVAGGREITLRSLQPLALYAANSLFVGDYLTTPGQEVSRDHQMIEDLGFEIERYAPGPAGPLEAESPAGS
jgi:biotin synthase